VAAFKERVFRKYGVAPIMPGSAKRVVEAHAQAVAALAASNAGMAVETSAASDAVAATLADIERSLAAEAGVDALGTGEGEGEGVGGAGGAGARAASAGSSGGQSRRPAELR
jgi:hypothetical protein